MFQPQASPLFFAHADVNNNNLNLISPRSFGPTQTDDASRQHQFQSFNTQSQSDRASFSAIQALDFGYHSAATAPFTNGPSLTTDPPLAPLFTPPTYGLSHIPPYQARGSGRRGAPNIAMDGSMEGSSGDMAAQQVAAASYSPDLEGPLIGNKTSSHAITAEYAKADPVYVAKTAALPSTYSHYRQVIGDGNCGWRAIAFSYFEVLQRLGNKQKILDELSRMTAMSDFIETATGNAAWLFEDMRDQMLETLQEIAETAHHGSFLDNESPILRRLNDRECSDPIVYYLRLIASAWMRTYPENYVGFLADGMTVTDYCRDVLEPVQTEIEHVGMAVLIDVLLKPVQMAVEIVYLDRTPGSHVNTHKIGELDILGNTIPANAWVFLLYRPGHYDILYKDANTRSSSQENIIQQSIKDLKNVRINRVASIPQYQPTSIALQSPELDFNALASIIPSYSYIGPNTVRWDGALSNDYVPLSPTATADFAACSLGSPMSSYAYMPTARHQSRNSTSRSSISLEAVTPPSSDLASPLSQRQHHQDQQRQSSINSIDVPAMPIPGRPHARSLSTSTNLLQTHRVAHATHPSLPPYQPCSPISQASPTIDHTPRCNTAQSHMFPTPASTKSSQFQAHPTSCSPKPNRPVSYPPTTARASHSSTNRGRSTSIAYGSTHTYNNTNGLVQNTNKIRPSKYIVESEYTSMPGPPPLQTATFKNSHYNTAHFNNPDFQPEEWRPEDE